MLIENGSVINVIYSMALEKLKVPIRYLNAPTLTIKAFNKTLATTMGIVILPFKVRV